MVVVGSGAIGSEFANFYTSMGTKVTLVEFLPNVVPVEDEEVSKQLGRSFKKMGMKVMVSSSVESVDTSGKKCKVLIKTSKGEDRIEADVVLSAVGITPNIENMGLEELGVEFDKGKVKVDALLQDQCSREFMQLEILLTGQHWHMWLLLKGSHVWRRSQDMNRSL